MLPYQMLASTGFRMRAGIMLEESATQKDVGYKSSRVRQRKRQKDNTRIRTLLLQKGKLCVGPNLAQKEATVLTGMAIMHMEMEMASGLLHDGEFLLVDVTAVLF
ncbi:uncharacterized protein LOC113462952 [Phoenix dactylifera]|uniref:Uncharacterized protein LOC113462952 n=1 Tax=Phoenix dactylifera TaxID=42345 RepID=A0A8B8J6I3_PHODC|nr:uncharacterized protein LOC113462952 [Phoenix dactylifera]